MKRISHVHSTESEDRRHLLDRDESYATPFSAAIPRARAIASAKLTDPELMGLILLRSRLPDEEG